MRYLRPFVMALALMVSGALCFPPIRTFAQTLGSSMAQTLPSVNLTATTNQIVSGAGSNLTTINFPASSGAVTLTMPTTTGALPSTPNLLANTTAPTISSGFGTSPSIAGSNGTAAFTINVGTGGAATSGVIGFPTATNGWVVKCDDITTQSASVFVTKQTASSATTATVTQYNTAAAATAWVASDILHCMAHGR